MKRTNSRILLLMSGFLFASVFTLQETKAAKDPCVYMSRHGIPGTWTEGSCYGTGSSCAANICI